MPHSPPSLRTGSEQEASPGGFRFPLLAFTTDGDLWSFHDEEELTTCGPMTLEKDMQLGMEVVDPSGNCWRANAVRRVGRAPFSWRLIFQPRMARIEHDWEAMPKLSLDEVQARVCACVVAHPDYYFDESDAAADVAQRQAEVRAAKSIEAIHGLFGLDNFRGY